MRNVLLKVVIGVSSIVVIISIIIIVNLIKSDNNLIRNDEEPIAETEKYDFEKTIEELSLKTKEDYLEYLLEIGEKIKPEELSSLANINSNLAANYYNADASKKEDGQKVLANLTAGAYRELLCRVIRHGEDWSELPLTKHFREKFKPESGVILEKDYIYHEGFHTYVGQFKYSDKLFSVSAESKEKGNYRKWYKFILDEEGYLDDVIFDHDEIVPLVPEWG